MNGYRLETDLNVITSVQKWKSDVLTLDPTVYIYFVHPETPDDKGLFAIAGKFSVKALCLSPACDYIPGIES